MSPHDGQRQLRDAKRPEHVGFEKCPRFGFAGFLYRTRYAISGVVDQYVQSSKSALNGMKGSLNVVGLGNINFQSKAFLPNFFG